MLSRVFRVLFVKMRYEVPEELSFSGELKLYLMKRATFCDADLEQYQVTHDFYSESHVDLSGKTTEPLQNRYRVIHMELLRHNSELQRSKAK